MIIRHWNFKGGKTLLLGWDGRRKKVVVGLMSGTSLDGIDAAVVRITGCGPESQVELLHYESTPYDPVLRERLKRLCGPEHAGSAGICAMNAFLGMKFAEAAASAAAGAGLRMEDVDLISSHGQTVWHIPERDPQDPFMVQSTLQIGDLSFIAKHTGVVTAGDFRPADMAVGGQGAPLVPYGDFVLFGHPEKGRLLQNIGGIGNCTAIPAGGIPSDMIAYDTGPGNMIIDEVVQVLSGGRLTYDGGGEWAAQGQADMQLVESLMSHSYFGQLPPKSTGRELFGKAYAAAFISTARARLLDDADIVATATAFTACSIADSYRRFVFPSVSIEEVIVSGGGAHNRELLRMLKELLPEVKVITSGELGFHDDGKEAIIFALLGNDFMHGLANNVPSATGASRATVMGKLALP